MPKRVYVNMQARGQVFGVILALTTFSWSATLIFDRDNQGEPRFGIQVTPRDDETFLEAVGRTAREEVDEFRVEIDRTDQQIERFFAREFNAEGIFF